MASRQLGPEELEAYRCSVFSVPRMILPVLKEPNCHEAAEVSAGEAAESDPSKADTQQKASSWDIRCPALIRTLIHRHNCSHLRILHACLAFRAFPCRRMRSLNRSFGRRSLSIHCRRSQTRTASAWAARAYSPRCTVHTHHQETMVHDVRSACSDILTS